MKWKSWKELLRRAFFFRGILTFIYGLESDILLEGCLNDRLGKIAVIDVWNLQFMYLVEKKVFPNTIILSF